MSGSGEKARLQYRLMLGLVTSWIEQERSLRMCHTLVIILMYLGKNSMVNLAVMSQLLESLYTNITVRSHMSPKLGSNGRGVGNFAHFKGSSLIDHTMCAYAL